MTLRMMVVNYANAIKLGGDKERALRELHKLDWSASDLSFQICIAAVEDNLTRVLSLMPQAAKSDLVRKSAYRDWPVFRTLREKAAFQEQFKSVYGEELVTVPPATVDVVRDPKMLSSNSTSDVQNKPAVTNGQDSGNETRH